jgi:hypothetical protein
VTPTNELTTMSTVAGRRELLGMHKRVFASRASETSTEAKGHFHLSRPLTIIKKVRNNQQNKAPKVRHNLNCYLTIDLPIFFLRKCIRN